MTPVKIDKKQLRELITAYERLSVEKERLRAEYEGARSPEQAFRDYQSLWNFGDQLQDDYEERCQEKIATMLESRRRIETFEAWRQKRATRS